MYFLLTTPSRYRANFREFVPGVRGPSPSHGPQRGPSPGGSERGKERPPLPVSEMKKEVQKTGGVGGGSWLDDSDEEDAGEATRVISRQKSPPSSVAGTVASAPGSRGSLASQPLSLPPSSISSLLAPTSASRPADAPLSSSHVGKNSLWDAPLSSSHLRKNSLSEISSSSIGGAAAGGAAVGADVGEAVVVAVTLNMDLNKVGDVEAFKRDVASDVSRALELDARSVKVLRLRAGSIIVDLEITPHARCNGRDLHQALVEQAKDSRSALMSGKYTSKTLAISPPRTRAEADKENKERVRASEAGLDLASPDASVGRGGGGGDGGAAGGVMAPELERLEELLKREPFDHMFVERGSAPVVPPLQLGSGGDGLQRLNPELRAAWDEALGTHSQK